MPTIQPHAGLAVVLALTGALSGAAQAEEPSDRLKNGAQAYRLCAACHSLRPGVHLSGPSLAGLWGRRSATIPDFGRYTEALKKIDVVWDEYALDPWITDPLTMVPGTTMSFRGLKDADARARLIAFLRVAMAPGGADKAVLQGLISAPLAQGQVPPDLSTAGPDRRVATIRHCGDAIHVTTADGATFPFWETNVRLKIDTGPRGPGPGGPVLLRSGMTGDRVSVVFSSAAELGRLVAKTC